jgi:hypothetical protein
MKLFGGRSGSSDEQATLAEFALKQMSANQSLGTSELMELRHVDRVTDETFNAALRELQVSLVI